MSLRQNPYNVKVCDIWFSYQSECHCAKTRLLLIDTLMSLVTSQNVTAPKHEVDQLEIMSRLVTSQNVTAPKLHLLFTHVNTCLVTSQNVTAPKPFDFIADVFTSLVTSQNVTAPKQLKRYTLHMFSLVTSQNVTAPKPLSQNLPCKETSIPTGSEIISEQSSRSIACLFSFILS